MPIPGRHALLAALLAGAQLAALPACAQSKPQNKSEQRREAGANKPGKQQQKNHPYAGAWLKRYENTPAGQGEQALRGESDFQKLPPERQQQLVNRLNEYSSKPPEERQRMVQRLQEIEKMPPQEREQLREANQQRKSLPQDRKRQVNRAYNFLRELPSPQQEQVINSPAFQQRFSGQELDILHGLLKAPQIEPPLGEAGEPPR